LRKLGLPLETDIPEEGELPKAIKLPHWLGFCIRNNKEDLGKWKEDGNPDSVDLNVM
jgi:hypothetical protein